MEIKGVINTIDEFYNLISKIQSKRFEFTNGYFCQLYQELYRGQDNFNYKLEPSIIRNIKDRNVLELEESYFNQFKSKIEANDGLKYIQLSISENIIDYENDWRYLEQMRHYGLPSRLLDWALIPEVALYFACEKHLDIDGQFWIFKSPLDWDCDDHFNINPFKLKNTRVCNSSFYVEANSSTAFAETNRGNQSGKFTIQNYLNCLIPLEEQLKFQELLELYKIPANKKENFLNFLKNERNIHSETIYSNLDNKIKAIVDSISI
ncbi:FRG domain-containing protein [Flavobacterium rhizosphaerae]|uniref:FRG domain-containing protein n=1 Tax=Flavobacterium rhizosphaerae TaxID=3163298 RepID=A0ABW8YSJ5_9FLAO